jgi:hypothetical protein
MPKINQTQARLKAACRSILKDDRLHPNKRVLVLLMLAYYSGTDWALDIIKEQFGSSTKIKFNEEDEPKAREEDKVNREARERIREIFGHVEETDANTSSK